MHSSIHINSHVWTKQLLFQLKHPFKVEAWSTKQNAELIRYVYLQYLSRKYFQKKSPYLKREKTVLDSK